MTNKKTRCSFRNESKTLPLRIFIILFHNPCFSRCLQLARFCGKAMQQIGTRSENCAYESQDKSPARSVEADSSLSILLQCYLKSYNFKRERKYGSLGLKCWQFLAKLLLKCSRFCYWIFSCNKQVKRKK